jgi:hypothetical protein
MIQLVNYEDGLWDLLLGTVFVLEAVYPLTRARLGPEWNLALFIGLLLIAVAVALGLRQRISTPRLGYVKARRTPALKWGLGVMIALVALTCSLVVVTLRRPEWLPNLTPSSGPLWLRSHLVHVAVLLFMVGVFSGMGYVFGVLRLYLYGWLLGGGNLAAALLYEGAPEGFNLPLGIAAAIIVLIGLGLLIRFLHKYPVQTLDC